MYNVHKSFSVFQTRWFLFLPLSVTDALYEPGYTKLSFVPNRWDFINISENCVCLDNTVFSVFLSSVFFRQCLKKCHLLLIVRFGTGTRVHRLLELFSVSFGVSKSQLKVRFSGVEATPVAIDHSAWSEAVLIRFSVLAELMQCRGECTWKIRWNAVKKNISSKSDSVSLVCLLSALKKLFHISFLFAFYSTCESRSWNLVMEVFSGAS